MHTKVSFSKEALAGFCRRHHIRRLSFFGSVLREDFGPHSDVDVLVEFQPGETPGFIRFARIEHEMSEMLGGRKIDLNTIGSLSRHFRDEILAEAREQYVEA